METKWNLSGVGQQVRHLSLRTAEGTRATVSPVLTVREACQRLRKSQRQVYRYVRGGRLRPCAKILDQWLFAKAEIERWLHCRIPTALKPFFWDVRLSTLSADHHRDFILARLLELGDGAAVRWVRQTYPPKEVRNFLIHRGAEVLSPRSWTFWARQVGVTSRRSVRSSWRRRGRAWGGLS